MPSKVGCKMRCDRCGKVIGYSEYDLEQEGEFSCFECLSLAELVQVGHKV